LNSPGWKAEDRMFSPPKGARRSAVLLFYRPFQVSLKKKKVSSQTEGRWGTGRVLFNYISNKPAKQSNRRTYQVRGAI